MAVRLPCRLGLSPLAILLAGLLPAAEYIPAGAEGGFIRLADREGGTAGAFAAAIVPAGARADAEAIRPRQVIPRREDGGWVLYAGGWPGELDGLYDLTVRRGPDPGAAAIRIPAAIRRETRRMDVALLLDDSHSMRATDPERLRVEAARLFARMAAARGDVRTLTLIAFNRRARLLLPPTPPAEAAAIDAALTGLEAAGATDIDRAFALAAEQLSALPPARKIAIVLSDGRDEPGRYTFGHRAFGARRWPVHTIGLSDAIDEPALRMIAASTGGHYHRAANTESLAGIFRDIANTLHAGVTIGEWELKPGATAVLPVDDTVRLLSLALVDAADEPAACRLRAADGIARALSTEWAADAFADLFVPVPGEWQVEGMRAASVLAATAVSPLDIVPFPAPSRPTPGIPLPFAAMVLDGDLPLTDAILTVRWPDGREERLQDDGLSADGVAGDGVFGGYLTFPGAGEFRLAYEAAGRTAAGHPYRRLARQMVNILAGEGNPIPPTDRMPPAKRSFEDPAPAVGAPRARPARPTQAPARAPAIRRAESTPDIQPTTLEPVPGMPRAAVPEPAPPVDALLPPDVGLLPVPAETSAASRAFTRWSIVLLLLAIAFLLWLTVRWYARPRKLNAPMAPFFAGSLLLHALLAVLLMDVLIQSRVITVEQVSPALAVTLESIEASLGIQLTPPGPAVPLRDRIRQAEVARSEAPALVEPLSVPAAARPAEAAAARAAAVALDEPAPAAPPAELADGTPAAPAPDLPDAPGIELVPVMAPAPTVDDAERPAAVPRPVAVGRNAPAAASPLPPPAAPALPRKGDAPRRTLLTLAADPAPDAGPVQLLESLQRTAAPQPPQAPELTTAPPIQASLPAVAAAQAAFTAQPARLARAQGLPERPPEPLLMTPAIRRDGTAAVRQASVSIPAVISAGPVPLLQPATSTRAEAPALPAPPALAAETPGQSVPPRPAVASKAREEASAPASSARSTARRPRPALAADALAEPGPIIRHRPTASAPIPAPVSSTPPPGAAPATPVAGELQTIEPGAIALRIGSGETGSRRVTIGLAQYGGDWDWARHAMTFLGHQLGERTRLAVHATDRVIALDSPDLSQLPFVYMTGHKDFHLTAREVANLRAYLHGGGYLWADDSTHYGDETFDKAFRRELARILPEAPLVRLGMDFEGFRTGYDLTRGFKGYAIPPGDKYRLDYIEGARIGRRVAVVYSRNDYGDGLNIDAHTHPLHASLTDLSPAEMQEGAIRMGMNLTLYFLTHGKSEATFMDHTASTLRRQPEADASAVPEGSERPLPVFAATSSWQHETWSDGGSLAADRGLAELSFTVGNQRKTAFSLTLDPPAGVTRQDVMMLTVTSRLRCGARLALALTVAGRYYEARPVYIKPGVNVALFPCGEATFKTEAGGWQYRDRLPVDAPVERITLLVYAPASGSMHLTNPRIIRRAR